MKNNGKDQKQKTENLRSNGSSQESIKSILEEEEKESMPGKICGRSRFKAGLEKEWEL